MCNCIKFNIASISLDFNHHKTFHFPLPNSKTCMTTGDRSSKIKHFRNKRFLPTIPTRIKNRMVGSSAMVGWVSLSVFVMKQYELDDKTPAQVKPDQGSLTLNLSLIGLQSNHTYMRFQLITAQPEFMLGSDYWLVQHQDKTAVFVNFASDQAPSIMGLFGMQIAGQAKPRLSRRYTGLRRSHGILNILGWSILMIAGIIVARHCKQYDPMWFFVRAAVQSSAFVLGLLGIICGFVLENKSSASSVSTHKDLGIFILVLGCLQVMAIWVRPRKGLKVREYWNWYHQNVGRVLITFAIANVFYGIHLGEEGKKWNLAYGISIGVLSVILIVLEIPKFRK
ncbi:hypothetical protein ACJRO7_030062 [Eucalyptus globulus]|uniref:Cytochrome b561 domain-containing protein n=1 Tax=Eucalyptus globulus TaxID=34317 RepID=A0ABD3JHJ1_EUCGL